MTTTLRESSTRPIEILLVEDSPGDVELTREAMREGRVANNLTVAKDGDDALDILLRQGAHADAARCDLILLDINLPKRNGLEVLAEIKRHESLRRIPVIVLTTSASERDLTTSYDLHANCYIRKPIDMDEFIEAVRSIERFWLSLVVLPPRMDD